MIDLPTNISGNKVIVDVAEIPKGTYVLKLKTRNQLFTSIIMKI